MSEPFKTVRILGISFFNDSFQHSIEIAHKNGGLFLAPSGPGLADLGKNPAYDRALQSADVNLIDSGYLALLWQKKTGEMIKRHSGLKFIKALIDDTQFKANQKQIWVMPSEQHSESTRDYLRREGIDLPDTAFYEAPYYDTKDIQDEILLEKIKVQQPDYIILAIAGGKQEVLGHWLRERMDSRPAIICIGAAIAFLSGQQANIPPWADRIYIGWLFRIITDPKTFLPRYWHARKLRSILNTYGEDPPVFRV
ncbi:MAG: WecB/TagA/CpsF family glycosyltransferase [Verrucomicrobiota bacterium]